MYDIQRYAICTLKPYRPTRYALVETDIIYTVFILILQQFINMKYYHHHPVLKNIIIPDYWKWRRKYRKHLRNARFKSNIHVLRLEDTTTAWFLSVKQSTNTIVAYIPFLNIDTLLVMHLLLCLVVILVVR